MRRKASRKSALLIVAIVLCATAAWLCPRIWIALRVVSGSVSHHLCSAAFVSHLDPSSVYAEELRPIPGMGLIAWAVRYDVDRDRQEVRTTVAGVLATRAVYNDGLGCLLLRDGPADIPPRRELPTPEPVAMPEIAPADVVVPQDPRLRAALDRDFAETTPPSRRTKAVVVVHEGRVIAERYAPDYGVGTRMLGHSLTKSVMHAVVGILVREGRLVLDRPVDLPAWRAPGDPRRTVTVDQLLRMTSGLPSDEGAGGFDLSSRMWFVERDMAGFAEETKLVASPGTAWAYSNAGYLILSRLVRDAVGGHAADVVAFLHRELFDPLGVSDAILELDSTGTPIGSNFMLATARDWARFGMLYLDDGVVGGRRLLPEGWTRLAASPTLDTGYGAGFWINGVNGSAPHAGIRWGLPHAPADAFFGRGYLGQYIVVVPSRRLVIVRLGLSHSRRFDLGGTGTLVADVTQALPD